MPHRSALSPDPQPLALPLVLAVVMHGFVVVVLVVATWFDWAPERGPIIDLRDTMEVSLVELKHSPDMPTRETVAPVPRGSPEAPRPETPPDAPPPPRQSDLVVPEPEPDPQPQGSPDRTSDRQRVLDELDRERQRREAIEGARDREATDPDSTATETTRAGVGPARGDPELARWQARVEEMFRDEFRPLPAVVSANPGIRAEYYVDFDPRTGRVTGFAPAEKSGNPSYDAAAERALRNIQSIPPPPERFRESFAGRRLLIEFVPPT